MLSRACFVFILGDRHASIELMILINIGSDLPHPCSIPTVPQKVRIQTFHSVDRTQHLELSLDMMPTI